MMFKKVLKWTGLGILVALLGAGGWLAANWKGVRNLAEVNSGWYAQMTCSCVFVTGRKEEDCKHYTRQFLPIKSLNVDRTNKSVKVVATFLMMYNTNTAKYEGPRYGCRLLKK